MKNLHKITVNIPDDIKLIARQWTSYYKYKHPLHLINGILYYKRENISLVEFPKSTQKSWLHDAKRNFHLPEFTLDMIKINDEKSS